MSLVSLLCTTVRMKRTVEVCDSTNMYTQSVLNNKSKTYTKNGGLAIPHVKQHHVTVLKCCIVTSDHCHMKVTS